MPDEMDRAQAREEEMRSDALEKQMRRAHGDGTIPSARRCAICGERIPELRRRLLPGVQTCVECQRDRGTRSRDPEGDATVERDAAPRAVAGIPCAGRSPCGGPSPDAPGRDREALSRGPFGDATAERDAAPRAVAGAHSAGRSPFGGPSSHAPGRDIEREGLFVTGGA